VGDAKNLRRTLLLTAQLAELGLPMVLALNMLDEAETAGVTVDFELLAERIGVAVCPTVATSNRGVAELVDATRRADAERNSEEQNQREAQRPPTPSAGQNPVCERLGLVYPPAIEAAVDACAPLLPESALDARAIGLLWLSADAATEQWVDERVDAAGRRELLDFRLRLAAELGEPVSTAIQQARLDWIDALIPEVMQFGDDGSRGLAWLTRMTTHRLWGWPVLAVVLYALYLLVGKFGAGTLVGVVEVDLFGKLLNPWLTEQVTSLVPSGFVRDLLVGDYGLWTMGMTYAFALILPVVTTFFLAFSVLEDSGYLSRMTVVSNRVFSMIGLNGKAVLPMVLGLGCVTMATLTTRILDTKRDRLLAIMLLALAVPCSAQLGVVLGLLGAISFTATAIWGVLIFAVLLTVGWLAARLIPGERSTLLVEMPPLRMPVASNVVTKTLARLEWYLREVVPLFLAGTLFLFVLQKTGALPAVVGAGRPVVTGWLGLPAAASAAFVVGFLRRDFGATGLFVMHQKGMLTPEQVVVAMVTITLFIPCVASVLMIARERGARTATAMVVAIFPLAFFIGGIVHRVLLLVGWSG
ncbi:MAG: ferrous iron transporter B, partial [Thermoleophilia bacterium]|nr:ferrous iron transporter B [Thermoleophilia bacterium]